MCRVIRAIAERIAHFWNESLGHLYPVLSRLLDGGLVTRTSEPGNGRPMRHVYAITEVGRQQLDSWLRESMVATPPRLEILLRTYFGAHIEPTVLTAHIECYRAERARQLAMLESVHAMLSEPATSEDARYLRMTVRAGVLPALGQSRVAAPAPVPDSARLALTLDSIRSAIGATGASAAIIFPGGQTWVGVSGEAWLGAPVTTATVFDAGSITKSYTAALVLRLVHEGVLALDDSLTRWFPGLPGGKGVTIEELLRQTSGLADYARHPGFFRRSARRWPRCGSRRRICASSVSRASRQARGGSTPTRITCCSD